MDPEDRAGQATKAVASRGYNRLVNATHLRGLINASGHLDTEPLALAPGTEVEVWVLVSPASDCDEELLLKDLQLAQLGSLSFWNNPDDDDAWNPA